MTPLQSFKDFLSSLVPLTQTHYQLWKCNHEMIFSTNGIPKDNQLKAYNNLFDRINGQNSYQYTICDGENFLCGIPLNNGQEDSAILVAFGREPNNALRSEKDKRSNDNYAQHMRCFLNQLIALLEENSEAKQEAEELAEELEYSFENLYLFGKISTQIKALRISDQMLKNLLGELLDNMRVDAVFTWFPKKLQYNFQVMNANISRKFKAKRNYLEKLIHMIPPNGHHLDENYFILNDSQENDQYKALAVEPYRFLSVKVQSQENFYGWLGLVSFNLKEIFRQGELKLLISIAEQLAGVIANTDLYEDLENFVISMVKSLVFAIEAKDIYTRGHSERVSDYSTLIGQRYGLEEIESNNLKWAAILHDIGKIGIPESILNKRDSLTEDEYEIIKRHPEKGSEILRPIEQLTHSLPGILHHHERYDGQGYPFGLEGEDIPLFARIIAVADTFDAISSTRAYRESKSMENAMEILEKAAGNQLDPGIVHLFKAVYEDHIRPKEKGSS